MKQERTEIKHQPRSEVNLRDYVRIVSARKWFVFLIFIVISGASVYYIRTATPVYEARAVLLRETNDKVPASIIGLPVTSTSKSIQSQERMLRSRLTVEDIKNKLKEDYSLVFTNSQVSDHVSLSVPKDEPDILEVVGTAEAAERSSALADTAAEVYIEKMKELERTELNQGVEFLKQQMELVDTKLQQSEQNLNEFREKEGLVITSKGASGGLLEKLGAMQSELSRVEIDIELVTSQLESVQALIDEKKSSLPFLSSLTTVLIPQVDRLQSKLIDLEVELAEKLDTLTEENPEVVATKQKIAAVESRLEAELAELLKKQGETSLDPISELRSLVQKSVTLNVQLRGHERRADLVTNRIAKFREEHPELISKQVQLTRLERQARMYEQTYMLLLDKYEEMRLLLQMKTPGLRFLDKAALPGSPVSPKKKQTLIFWSLIGLFLGVFVAFFLEYLDDSIKRKEDVDRFLGLPVMGAIPVISPFAVPETVLDTRERAAIDEGGASGELGEQGDEDAESEIGDLQGGYPDEVSSVRRTRVKRGKGHRKRLEQLLRHSILYAGNKSPVAESYRTLSMNIMYADIDKPVRTLLVTSSIPSEGKTITASNLAITMARGGKRVLVMDTDLRRPRLHRIFQQDRSPGLTDFLTGESELSQPADRGEANPQSEANTNTGHLLDTTVINRASLDGFIRPTEVENLFLFPCGSHLSNPGLLLSSESMSKLIQYLASQYDMIIFDSPPLASVADAVTLSTETDATLLVIKSGKTKRRMVQEGKELLENVDADIMGVVLNNMDYSKQYGSYYYYYYRHYYYSSDEEE